MALTNFSATTLRCHPSTIATGSRSPRFAGVLAFVHRLVKEGATHIGVATDHVIESFRNGLWPAYKTGAGVPAELLAQFPLLEDALRALGLVVWPMVEFEADDALASAAHLAAQDPRVSRVLICTPDKDLAQCVRGGRVMQRHSRNGIVLDEEGILAKFGVLPRSIPDYLALVGDSADGFPGLRGWGAKSAAAVLRRYSHLEHIPADPRDWSIPVASPAALSEVLKRDRERALLFRDLATLRSGLPLFENVDDLRWHGPAPGVRAAGGTSGRERPRRCREANQGGPREAAVPPSSPRPDA